MACNKFRTKVRLRKIDQGLIYRFCKRLFRIHISIKTVKKKNFKLKNHGWCADSVQNYKKQNALIKTLLPYATMIQGFSHIPIGEVLDQVVRQKIKSFYSAYEDILKLWNADEKSAKLIALFEEYSDFRDYGAKLLIPEVSDYFVQKQINSDFATIENVMDEEQKNYLKRKISDYYKRKRKINDHWSLNDKRMHVEMRNLYKDYENFIDKNGDSIISDIRAREDFRN